MAGMGIPVPLLLIPLYKILITINLIDNLFGLILVYVAVSIPFTIFILTGFFSTIPKEMDEASKIDGCSEFQTYYRIMVPMAMPGIVTAFIFNFIFLWNEYMLALVFIRRDTVHTLTLGLYKLQYAMQYNAKWVTLFAGSVINIIPLIIIYLILSEKLISGITLGALK